MWYKDNFKKVFSVCNMILIMIIFAGCSDIEVPEIKCTCKKKADLSGVRRPDMDDSYLLTCIYNGDLEGAKKYASKHDLDEKRVPSAVMLAIKCNRPEILEWLLDNGWSANPEQYDSALATAFKHNCKLVRILLENDAELNKREMKHWISDDYKRNALHYAISSGKACMVKTALECDLDADPGSSYYPPLMEAIHFAHKDLIYAETVCRLLVQYGADPDEEGEVFVWQKRVKLNPAEYLVRHGVSMSSSLFAFLMDQGADADYKPEDLRKMANPGDVIGDKNKLFRKYPEIREELLRSYLLMICSGPEMPGAADFNKKLLEAIDDADIDLNQKLPGESLTPLQMAKKNKNKKLCDLLIKYGAK